jgi:hypothetical protein
VESPADGRVRWDDKLNALLHAVSVVTRCNYFRKNLDEDSDEDLDEDSDWRKEVSSFSTLGDRKP